MVYIIYKDRAGEWRWFLQAANGRKIADSAEGYINKQDCLAGIGLVKRSQNTPIYER